MFLEDNVAPEDTLACTNDSLISSLEYYSRGKPHQYYYFFDPKIPDTNWNRPVMEGGIYVPLKGVTDAAFHTVWMVCSDFSRNGGFDENSRSVRTAPDKIFKLDSAREIEGVWIYKYVKNDS